MRRLSIAPTCFAALLLAAPLPSVATGAADKPVADDATKAAPAAFSGAVINDRLIEIPNSQIVLATWQQTDPASGLNHYYAVSLDGRTFSRARQTSYTVRLRYANFEPLSEVPAVDEQLAAPASSRVYLVQFAVPPLEVFREQITTLGGEVVRFLGDHVHIVRMDAQVAAEVATLPYVRWVGVNHVAYKLEQELLDLLLSDDADQAPARYSIEVFVRGDREQNAVADFVVQIGGEVNMINPYGFRMEATLTPTQLLRVASLDEVYFIDLWGPGETDVDIARELSGATPLLSSLGFTGVGVRGEIFDTGVNTTHPAFANPNPLAHNANSAGSHGTNVYGIVFGNGWNRPAATGFLPDREQGIWANHSQSSHFGGPVSRHLHTAQLVDPAGPYRAVFQTASVGSPRNSQYTTISADTDDYLFISQLLSTQSMSNANLQPQVRPQAWAKNIVGCGGITHNNTLSRADDRSSGSTGPAADNRIKPDLSHFYDNILTTSGTSSYTTGFGGTSGATPLTVGNFGVFFQMWHEGVWPNHGGGTSVFDSRAKMATAKAMMINFAFRYIWTAGGANGNMFRDRQGWGMADVGHMYDRRDVTFIVDEEDIITPLAVNSYDITVLAGESELNVTMVYADPMGPTSATQHRINDLSLRVTAPNGTQYWGNNGLRASNWSTPGGTSNTKDTVENVFIQNPEAGMWLVEVLADEINQDGHVETPALDADYALVVSGGLEAAGCAGRFLCGDTNCDGRFDGGDVDPFLLAVGDPNAWMAMFPKCDLICTADINGDGRVNGGDIDLFFEALRVGVCP
ncbi:MAG: S8 family serine peptidase [Planctomycetes bacterium]|nr:S8 family serine peptidase [Planctomycetota bacterium]